MRLRGFLFTLTTACLFGLGLVLAKLIGETFQPFFASWLCLFGSGLCICVCQLLRHKPLLPRMPLGRWVDLLLFASIGTALPLACLIVSLPQTGAVTGSFLIQLQTPAALLLAVVLLKEKILWQQVLAIIVLLFGSLLVILRDTSGLLTLKADQSDLLVLIAAIGIGFSYIPGKRLSGYADVFQINLLRVLVGSCFLLPLLAFQTNVLLMALSWSQIGIMALYVVANFVVGYVLLQLGLSLLQAWESSAILQSIPLFSTVFAVVLLHESLTFLQLIGGCIILIGGFLVVNITGKREDTDIQSKERQEHALPSPDRCG